VPPRAEPIQLAVGGSERLCIWRAPSEGGLRARIVHVPAVAEEMNKCRPMVAEASRRLAAQGFGVLEIDLLGCGDSAGDFGDATFEAWLDDIRAAIAWTEKVGASAPLWLWATRGGAPLAAEVARHVPEITGLLLWQPVLSGRTHLTQFLRVKLASDVVAGGGAGEGTRALRDVLRAGQAIEVAGYALSPTLAQALDAATFACPEQVASVVWLEVGTGDAPELAPVSRDAVAALRGPRRRVEAKAVSGASFWQTVETERAPALVDATVSAMTRMADDAHR
jgi:exosortase A-associated hydrolase 2